MQLMHNNKQIYTGALQTWQLTKIFFAGKGDFLATDNLDFIMVRFELL